MDFVCNIMQKNVTGKSDFKITLLYTKAYNISYAATMLSFGGSMKVVQKVCLQQLKGLQK